MRTKHYLLIAFALAAPWLVMAPSVQAQQTAKVVASCGSATYTAGSVNYETIDTAGNSCGASGGAPVGTQNVNLTGINGSPPSLTNPIFTAYAEAGDTAGTFTNATQSAAVTANNADGYATALVSINGTYGTATALFQASDDGGVTFYSMSCVRSDGTAVETGYTGLTNTNRQWFCPVSGNDSFRVQSSAVASGTVNVRISISAPPTNSAVVSGPTGTGANQVQGTSASAATDDGSNPVKFGCVFLSSPPTFTNGQRGNCQITQDGSLRISVAGSASTTKTGIAANSAFFGAPGQAAAALPLTVTPVIYNGVTQDAAVSINGAVAAGTGDQAVAIAPTSAAAAGLPVATTAAVASNQVLKASPGNGYRYAITTGASAGFFMIFDATTAPADGAVTPKICRAVAANTSLEINHSPQPDLFTVGIVEVFSTTGCFTKTASATAEMEGSAQ